MRVVLAPADHGACGLYRMRLPAQHLTGQIDIEVVDQLPIKVRWSPGDTGRVFHVEPINADVLVLQRPMNRLITDAIPYIKAQGVTVVVEIDDDMHALHPANAAWSRVHPRNTDHNIHHLSAACKAADLVTVTTPALAARYAAHGRYMVIPNVVPAWLLDVTAERDGSTVGWSGTIANHPDDLQVTSGAVGRTGAKFRAVGVSTGVRDALRLDHEPDATGWLPYKEYIGKLATLDVGIVPLADTAFNKAKSGLKGLEMAALDIPFVASPAADYMRLAADGIGTIVRKPRAWQREITRLLADPALREDTAAKARQAVAERHTYETQAWRWAEAWQHALDRLRAPAH